MKKLTVFFITLLALTIVLAHIAYAGQYHGGPGAGYDMAEYAGRIDGTDGKQEGRQAENTTLYRGGPGAGYDMAEYAGRIDGSKDEPQGREKSWGGIIQRLFKRRTR